MSQTVCVIGAGRTDFKRHIRREGKTLRDLILEAGTAALAESGVDPTDIDAGVVGSFASGQFTKQLHLGAILTELDPRMHGLPTFHVEAACASGGVAVLTAAQLIMGGIHDVVLVVGVEQQKTMPPAAGAEVLGAAGDFATESAQFGDYMFPKLFARIAQIYRGHYPLTDEDLARVAVKNRAHARLNPLAQMRDVPLTLADASTVSESNPRLAPPLKATDCSQITDGAAAVVLCSERFAEQLARRPVVRLLGYGHTTDYLPLWRKDVPHFHAAARAGRLAFSMANLKPRDLHGVEVHDCFTFSEILAYEILELAAHGEGPQLLATGATTLPQVRDEIGFSALRSPSSALCPPSLPVNASGGLIGDGHPVGATGVRQVVEAYRQITGAAGRYQIDGAARMLTYNVGGSFTSNVVMIWGK